MSLKVSAKIAEKVKNGEISTDDAARFSRFVDTCNRELMTHSVITDNKFCQWFAKGEADRDCIRHFITQFSVFSNLFLVAQTLKVINAGSLGGMRASKEILANELGVIFNNKGAATEDITDTDRQGDPEIVSIEGTVDGGTFRFKAAHFEWLLKFGAVVGLSFKDMGKRRNGSPATIFFCDQLMTIYGHEDPSLAEGASFAVENWAAAGFWKQLIKGLEIFKEREEPGLPLAFFTWHDRIEDQHAGHVMDELEALYFDSDFDEEKFIAGGRDMLNGVEAFWVGLNEHRMAAAYISA